MADNVNLPLRIIPAVHEEGRARVNINLKVSADFSYKLFGSNIVVKVRACIVERAEFGVCNLSTRDGNRQIQTSMCECVHSASGKHVRTLLLLLLFQPPCTVLAVAVEGRAGWTKPETGCPCQPQFAARRLRSNAWKLLPVARHARGILECTSHGVE